MVRYRLSLYIYPDNILQIPKAYFHLFLTLYLKKKDTFHTNK